VNINDLIDPLASLVAASDDPRAVLDLISAELRAQVRTINVLSADYLSRSRGRCR
jgi:hypothetical protein